LEVGPHQIGVNPLHLGDFIGQLIIGIRIFVGQANSKRLKTGKHLALDRIAGGLGNSGALGGLSSRYS
jgi:hypothetical protein